METLDSRVVGILYVFHTRGQCKTTTLLVGSVGIFLVIIT